MTDISLTEMKTLIYINYLKSSCLKISFLQELSKFTYLYPYNKFSITLTVRQSSKFFKRNNLKYRQ
eukprot:UN27772